MPEFSTNIPIICLESETFKSLVKELAIEIRDDEVDPWIDGKGNDALAPYIFKNDFPKIP